MRLVFALLFFLLSAPPGRAQEEGERHARVVTENGVSGVRLRDDEIAVNGIETAPGGSVPPSALVWNDGKQWIYVQEKEGFFTRTAPAAAPSEKRVVVRGAQALLSEEFGEELGEESE